MLHEPAARPVHIARISIPRFQTIRFQFGNCWAPLKGRVLKRISPMLSTPQDAVSTCHPFYILCFCVRCRCFHQLAGYSLRNNVRVSRVQKILPTSKIACFFEPYRENYLCNNASCQNANRKETTMVMENLSLHECSTETAIMHAIHFFPFFSDCSHQTRSQHHPDSPLTVVSPRRDTGPFSFSPTSTSMKEFRVWPDHCSVP